jgi:hypothetical protein
VLHCLTLLQLFKASNLVFFVRSVASCLVNPKKASL